MIMSLLTESIMLFYRETFPMSNRFASNNLNSCPMKNVRVSGISVLVISSLGARGFFLVGGDRIERLRDSKASREAARKHYSL